MKELNKIEEITEDSYFIFKHSVTCPISAGANDVINSVESKLNVPVYLVIVQKNRELSDIVARRYGIQHESPQLLLIRDGRVVWNQSHYSIQAQAIQQALADV